MKQMKMTTRAAALLACMVLLAASAFAGITVRPTSITGNAQDGFVVTWPPNSQKTFDADNTNAVSLSALTQAKAYMAAGGKVLIIWRLESGKYKLEVDLYPPSGSCPMEQFEFTLGG